MRMGMVGRSCSRQSPQRTNLRLDNQLVDIFLQQLLTLFGFASNPFRLNLAEDSSTSSDTDSGYKYKIFALQEITRTVSAVILIQLIKQSQPFPRRATRRSELETGLDVNSASTAVVIPR